MIILFPSLFHTLRGTLVFPLVLQDEKEGRVEICRPYNEGDGMNGDGRFDLQKEQTQVANNDRESRVGTLRRVDDIQLLLHFSKRYLNEQVTSEMTTPLHTHIYIFYSKKTVK